MIFHKIFISRHRHYHSIVIAVKKKGCFMKQRAKSTKSSKTPPNLQSECTSICKTLCREILMAILVNRGTCQQMACGKAPASSAVTQHNGVNKCKKKTRPDILDAIDGGSRRGFRKRELM
ncbi:hypothetical protein CDAR_320151 [Caerostris darwini]|uniref:Uncharacterized protein n=1 Tax=Caerostris darwini TaxID=1538125 RepID=A0AAV4NJ06_9ARAC|nr:hypothetical protein CDAR_320151 [Caerostris darwini]